MDSVDDSIVVTPTDTSNISSPESSSSDVSQPTVKLRLNNDPKYRKNREDSVKRRSSVMGHQPFLQMLDKDGCQLVETTGRTAQRARASIRDVSRQINQNKSYQSEQAGAIPKVKEYPLPRSFYRPRKSRSSTSVETHDGNANRRIKKRYSYGVQSSRKSWDMPEVKEIPKRYSTGDYLRQQILEDLNSNEIIGKTEEQIAQDRCNRVKAYLRRRKEDAPYISPEVRLRELKDCWKSEGKRDNCSTASGYTNRRKDLDRIRAYLQEKIRLKMDEEQWNISQDKKSSAEYPKELSLQDIRKRYSECYRKKERSNYPTRRVRSDANIRLETVSSGSGQDDGKFCNNSILLNRTRNGIKRNACRRTKSNVASETANDPDDSDTRRRYHSFTSGRQNSWKTRSGLTFDKKLSLPSKTSINLDRESDSVSPGYKQNDWQYVKNSNDRSNDVGYYDNDKKYYRRTRSDTLPEKLSKPTNNNMRKTKRRSVSWSDKRKVSRRPSDRFAELTGETSLDSDKNSTSFDGRTKNQQANSLCSWREYKEKRRQDRLRRELANVRGDEDFPKICMMPAAWKNLQEFPDTNFVKSQKLQTVENEEIAHQRKLNEQDEIRYFENDRKRNDSTTNENCIRNTKNVGDTTDDTETETILQENYLLLEPVECKSNIWSPTISRLQVNEYRDPEDSLPYELNSSDIGYDTIPKNRGGKGGGCRSIEFNANSNVKKSDTFKIVDGSEDALDSECQLQSSEMCNFDSNKTGWLSNDAKSSSFGRALMSCNDDAEQANMTSITSRHSDGDNSQASDGITASSSAAAAAAVVPSNKDIARDYFKRVYELLKQRKEEDKREIPEIFGPTRHDGDTSSSNYAEQEELRKRRRRRKKDKIYQGEELVAVSPGSGGNDGWTVQRLLVNNDNGNLIFRRPQFQNVTGNKRPRHPAPPIPVNCKINVKDISKYFDYPNKENSPKNGVNENKRVERIEEREQEQQQQQQQQQQINCNENEMGSNLSRHNGKGLTGRRTQSSGNLCDPKGKLNHVGKILVPCSSTQRERYKICGSLPNHLDDKEILEDDDARENNNVISDTMVGNLGGTLPHKKRSLGVHFSDSGPTGMLDLVKHRSQDSLEGDPWRYQDGADLDLVRCKHGNFDLVRKNQNVDVTNGDSSSKRYGTIGRSTDSKCHRRADLDLVGALPKRRTGETKGAVLRQSFEFRQNRSVDHVDGDLLMKVVHKPDCELMKHRQFDRAVDLKLSRLLGGEPQDQGYASERSPEDEHPPSLPGQPFPNVTPDSTFRVILQKSSRGLGLSVSGGGTAGPVRVKRLFPQQPAALSNKLQPGDILLAANGVPLTGLTNYEALEVLRTTPSTVELVVCRLPGDASITPPGAPPPPPTRREPPPPLRILNPLPPLQIEPCGEFDIEMTKVAGSLGFTLRKVDSSALGHYVRALVREPALSDGRIQPGDKIVAVDGTPLSPMSHEEAVALLRQCGPRVKLRLYRDLAQTPVSALSPTEPDHPLRPPRTSLRQEAVDMLCDLAVRKLSPGTSNGSSCRQTSAGSCNSPRRLRRPPSRTPTAENDNENPLTFHPVHPPTTSQNDVSDTDQCSINTQATNSQSDTPVNDIIDPPPLYDVCDSSDSSKPLPPRPSFLNLSAPPEKPHFQFSLESDSEYTGPIIVTESDSNLTAECDYEEDEDFVKDPPVLSSDEHDNNLPSEPASMPPLSSTTRTTSGVFSYKNPAYQSANPTCGGIDNSAKSKAAHSSDQDIPGKILGVEDPVGSKGLLKWKGVMFAPNDGVELSDRKTEEEQNEKETVAESTEHNNTSDDGNEVFMVELTRGWNSRLGFSLQPEGNSTVISVVHPDSVAAKDGRLKQGDVLIMVNDESVENVPTAEIIDLLRKIRGSIGITVMRRNKPKNVS